MKKRNMEQLGIWMNLLRHINCHMNWMCVRSVVQADFVFTSVSQNPDAVISAVFFQRLKMGKTCHDKMLESLVGPQVRPSWIKVGSAFLNSCVEVTVVKKRAQNSSLRCGGKATKCKNWSKEAKRFKPKKMDSVSMKTNRNLEGEQVQQISV